MSDMDALLSGEYEGDEALRLMGQCNRIFSPSAPIDRYALFAGRIPQVEKVAQAVGSRGSHAIIYGDRGVGKTSLANILKEVFKDDEGMKIVRVNCSETDTFRSIWMKALVEVQVVVEAANDDPAAPTHPIHMTLDAHAHESEQLGPGEIRRILQRWSQDDFEMVLVFDEFDRLPEDDRAMFADTIKDLSDHSVSTTVVLVGVADDVDHLFEEHRSIERCLVQIRMPLMSRTELADIVTKAILPMNLHITPDALNLIVTLSQGFPHYTHLLGQQSTLAAIRQRLRTIGLGHVKTGITQAIGQSQQTIQNAYVQAIRGQRQSALFKQVLLSCALAAMDEVGTFSSADVRDPLRQVTGKDYDIPNFAQHLVKFSADDLGVRFSKRSGRPGGSASSFAIHSCGRTSSCGG